MYIRIGRLTARSERAGRTRHFPWMIQQTMCDQQLGENIDRLGEEGTSTTVHRPWVPDDDEDCINPPRGPRPAPATRHTLEGALGHRRSTGQCRAAAQEPASGHPLW